MSSTSLLIHSTHAIWDALLREIQRSSTCSWGISSYLCEDNMLCFMYVAVVLHFECIP